MDETTRCVVYFNTDESVLDNPGNIGAGGILKIQWRLNICLFYSFGARHQQSSRSGGSCIWLIMVCSVELSKSGTGSWLTNAGGLAFEQISPSLEHLITNAAASHPYHSLLTFQMHSHTRGSQLCGRFTLQTQPSSHQSPTILHQPANSKRGSNLSSAGQGRHGKFQKKENEKN